MVFGFYAFGYLWAFLVFTFINSFAMNKNGWTPESYIMFAAIGFFGMVASNFMRIVV